MRFILFDRIIELNKGHKAVLLKNVSQSEDYFIDHFPGYPVVPGSIIVGGFEQGAEIFLGASCDFTLRPVLKKLSRVSFRRFVLPGDQIEITVAVQSADSTEIQASAQVQGKRVAEARLDFVLEKADGNPTVSQACERLKKVYELMTSSAVSKVWSLWEGQS